MNNAKKTLAKNSIIFTIANFGSKILKIIIVPFYTYCLSTEQFGIVDIISTTVYLLYPFVLMGLNEGVLRYSMKENLDTEKVFSTCFVTVIAACITSLWFYFPVLLFPTFKEYWWISYAILVATAIESFLGFYARGAGRNISFAVSGVVNTIVLLASNVIFLVFFKMNIRGYLLSMALASSASIVYLTVQLRIWKVLSVRWFDLRLLKRILIYSLPLMPNALMWWIMNSSDRYIIIYLFGLSSAGIYAISYKIPSIVSMVSTIFHQAWQLSAINENVVDKNQEFFSSVYKAYYSFSFIVVASICLLVHPLMSIFSVEFHEAWKYVPFLVLAAAFSGLSGFVGVCYTVSENTIGSLCTSMAGAVVNIILNVVLSSVFNMQGTAIATFIAFYIVWILRAVHSQKVMRYNQSFLLIHTNLLFIIIEILLTLNEESLIFRLGVFVLVLGCNRRFLKESIAFIKDSLKKVGTFKNSFFKEV